MKVMDIDTVDMKEWDKIRADCVVLSANDSGAMLARLLRFMVEVLNSEIPEKESLPVEQMVYNTIRNHVSSMEEDRVTYDGAVALEILVKQWRELISCE